MLKIGSHVSMNSKDMLVGSVLEALSYEANAFMIYTGAPQNTRRSGLEKLKINEMHELMDKHQLSLDHVIVHAPYIMNLANPDPSKYQFAVDFLSNEIERTHAIGAKQIVLHPGAHVGTGEDLALNQIIRGINEVFTNVNNDVRIALETMAGKGTEVGKTFEELATIISGVTHNERLSVCFDTCHTHDFGYEINNNFDGVIDHFDKTVGIDRISVFHINDSKNLQGARKDRHENIGFGFIGFDALNYIVNHKQFIEIPKILETPYIRVSEEQSFPPYFDEICNFRKQEFNRIGNLKYL
ncbi:MAG: Endonuclease [Haloplasmataceae bacterium]|jgi:deoxyribonuclease-4|nr:Endonuclease [Haloplasmataceae bacterium]